MGKQGMYIYGVLNSNASLHLSIPKDLLLPPHQYIGVGGLEESESNGVYTIAYQDISALVRGSEIVDYAHMRKDILARLLIGHQTVIERVMTAQTTIIPMRLGIFAQDETEVKEILNKGYSLTKQIFEKIKDKIEIDVVASWSDFNSIIKEAGEEKEIKEFKEKLLSNPKGITVDDQMKVGSMLKKALDERRDKFAKEIQDNLKTFCVDFKTHELMDDKMVVNIAFLIDKNKQKDFDKKVEELNAKFNEKLNFRCVGPLPAYSFFTIEIKKMQFNDVNLARKRLGILEDRSSKDDIKKAFHRQVFIFHPDRNPNKPGIEKEYDEIVRSYNMLLDYAQACEQVGLPAPRPDVFYVYAIRCNNESLYIGHTDDLRKRYQGHVEGTAAQWTKKYKPLYVAHYEEYNSREEAVKREKELKTGFGRKWLKREIRAGRARQAGEACLIFNEDEFRKNAVLVKVRE